MNVYIWYNIITIIVSCEPVQISLKNELYIALPYRSVLKITNVHEALSNGLDAKFKDSKG